MRIGGPNNDRIKVDVYKMGGELTGRSDTKQIWGTTDSYGFDISVKRGGIKCQFEFSLGHKYVNEEYLPAFKMETSHFNLDYSLIKFMIHPGYNDYTVKIAYAFLNGLKAPFIGTLELSLNGSFLTIANALISNWEN